MTNATAAHKYRIFLSYARVDRQLAERIVEALERAGTQVLWDKNISAGHPFSEAIRGFIANSHIFMPLITAQSKNRPWLHREQGYALALNVPLVPLVIGSTDAEGTESFLLAENIQSIQVLPDCSNL